MVISYTFKPSFVKIISILFFIILFSAYAYTFAIPPVTKYEAGETLDPDCLPGDTNCTVNISSDLWLSNGLNIYNNGSNVGIGTNSPTSLLNIEIESTLSYQVDNSMVTGLNDAVFSGSYTGSEYPYIVMVTINSEGNPDTFNYSGVSQSGNDPSCDGSNISITGSPQFLCNGFSIDFNSTTGHTSGDVFGYGIIFSFDPTEAIKVNAHNNNYFIVNAVAPDSNFIGKDAGFESAGSIQSNFIGYQSGYHATNASASNFLGATSGYNATNASGSNFFGEMAGRIATNASNSNFLGNLAGFQATNASFSNFIGSESGRFSVDASNSNFFGQASGFSSENASNSIFIGQKAGYQDTVDNTTNINDWSILIGYNTNTGGFKNSILLGGSNSTSPISNTKTNQFMLAPTIVDMRLRGIDYNLPSSQGGVNTILTNDGSGGLSWGSMPSAGANSLGNYIVQTSTNAPTNAQVLGSLGTGLLKNTTTTGVLSIASAGVDYLTPSGASSIYVPYTGATSNFDLGIHNLTVDTNSLIVDSSTHRVGVGVLSPSYRLDVSGDTRIQGGIVGIGASPLTNNLLFVNNYFNGTASQTGIRNLIYFSPTSNSGNSGYGLISSARKNGNFDMGNIYGVYGLVSNEGNANMSSANVFSSTVTLYGTTSSGTITNGYGLIANSPTRDSGNTGTIGSIYGVRVQNQGNTYITNAYGIYIENQTGASTINYNLYSVGGVNYFGGNVGIGQLSPSYKLHVGDATVSGIVARFTNSTGTCDINPTTASLVCSSDMNLKKNIKKLDYTDFVLSELGDISNKSILERINYLTPVTYNWNIENDEDDRHIGLIAQEVDQIFPDLVFTDLNTGNKSIAYTNLTPYLIEAIKELDIKVNKLHSLDTTEENSFGSLLKNYLTNIDNKLEIVFFGEVRTKKLCIDDVCIDKNQLEQILNNTNITTVNNPIIEEEQVEINNVESDENTIEDPIIESSDIDSSSSDLLDEENVLVNPEIN